MKNYFINRQKRVILIIIIYKAHTGLPFISGVRKGVYDKMDGHG